MPAVPDLAGTHVQGMLLPFPAFLPAPEKKTWCAERRTMSKNEFAERFLPHTELSTKW